MDIQMEIQKIRDPITAEDLHKLRTGLVDILSVPYYMELVKNRMVWDQCPKERVEILAPSLPGLLAQATVFLWTKDIFDASMKGQEIFDKTIWHQDGHSLLGEFHGFDNGVLSWGQYLDLFDIPKESKAEAKYFLIQPTFQQFEDYKASTAFMVFFMPQITVGARWTRENILATVPYLRVLHAVRDEGETFFPYTMVSAMREFLALKLVDVHSYRLPRPERRRMERARISEPDIRIVQLRKAETRSRVPLSDPAGNPIERHYQWIVHGHWRKQWYPSLAVHKPKYISEYIKGPDGKPLLPPKQTVYVVNR